MVRYLFNVFFYFTDFVDGIVGLLNPLLGDRRIRFDQQFIGVVDVCSNRNGGMFPAFLKIRNEVSKDQHV